MNMKVSNEVWVATALLQRERPDRESFQPGEVRERAQAIHPGEPLRPGVNVHIYLHCVANKPPSSARYRMLYRLPDNSLRLYRNSDPCDPGREKGRMTPESTDLPPEFRPLLDWYREKYNIQPKTHEDPIRGLVGLGKDTWKSLGGGEAILKWLRSDEPQARAPWEEPLPPQAGQSWHADATATFWENVRELRKRDLLPRRWRVSDLRSHLEDIYSPNTIETVPANSSISADGSVQGDYVKKGRRPEAVRLGNGLYELMDDPDRRAA